MPRLALALLLACHAFAEEAPEPDVASSLPEDIPGGREQAAKALKSGVPQLVVKVLEDVAFAQEEPVFAPWRVALEGRASEDARDPWIVYTTALFERDISCPGFRRAAAAWFEQQADMTPELSALLTANLNASSGVLAKRHERPAREGNMNALLSLSGNPEGHGVLLELCRAEAPEPRRLVYAMAASRSRSVLFRPVFEEWKSSDSPQLVFCGVNGILRLGDPADLPVAVEYFKAPHSYRRFETYRSLSWIRTKEAVDVLLGELPGAADSVGEALVVALSRESDERVLPALRKLRDEPAYRRGVCAALWRQGRAGDVPWLCDRMEEGEPEAARTLRRLLGRAVPIEFAERVPAVRKWIQEHAAAIEKDEELPKK